MKITENLMMASRTNNIEDVADNMIRKTFIDPIAKIVNDDSHMRNSITAALLETIFFTFYKTAVYTVAKSAILANPLRVLGLKMNPIKLYGAMELAPMTGVADIICDLTATGQTLKANGLVEYDDLFYSTARLVANRSAMMTSFSDIQSIYQGFKQHLGD